MFFADPNKLLNQNCNIFTWVSFYILLFEYPILSVFYHKNHLLTFRRLPIETKNIKLWNVVIMIIFFYFFGKNFKSKAQEKEEMLPVWINTWSKFSYYKVLPYCMVCLKPRGKSYLDFLLRCLYNVKSLSRSMKSELIKTLKEIRWLRIQNSSLKTPQAFTKLVSSYWWYTFSA